MALPPDLQRFLDQYDAADRELSSLLEGLPETLAEWRAAPHTWSVAQCIQHLGITNRAYLAAMSLPLSEARQKRKLRRGAARPGPFGGFFAWNVEPPVRRVRIKAPDNIIPAPQVHLANALQTFHGAQDQIRAFISENADLDLTRILFPNPFFRGLRFGLASALQIMASHERRHLWQAWNIRREAEQASIV